MKQKRTSTHQHHRRVTGIGGIAVGAGRHLKRAGENVPYSQSNSSSPSSSLSVSSASSTYTPTPTPSSGSSNTSLPPRRSRSWSFRNAAIRSSASVALFGGSSRICSQPTGGDPGGDIKKFLSSGGGFRKLSLDGGERVNNGLLSARNTRRVVGELNL